MEKDNLLFDFEIKNLTKNSQEIIEELNRFSDFLKTYISTTKDLSNLLKEKLKIPENHPSRLHESILLTNIIGIYDSFQTYLIRRRLINRTNCVRFWGTPLPKRNSHQAQKFL